MTRSLAPGALELRFNDNHDDKGRFSSGDGGGGGGVEPKSEGEKNYAGLTDEEKAQYRKDWNAAQKASEKAKTTGTAEDHVKAVKAHDKAAESATSPEKRLAHRRAAEAHGAAARKQARDDVQRIQKEHAELKAKLDGLLARQATLNAAHP